MGQVTIRMNPNYIQQLITKIDNDELLHYASEYYDPAKAHEYYLKNRQLKGRTGLSDEGKDVWDATKNNISAEKKSRLKDYAKQKEIDIKNSRDKAEAIRTEITNKLKALSDKLNAKYKSDNDAITKQMQAISSNKSLSKEQKAEKRAELVAQRQKLSSNRKDESSKNASAMKAERTKTASDLKAAIESAREMYTKNKESLDSNYEAKTQNEYDNIKEQYTEVKKGRGSKSTKKKK